MIQRTQLRSSHVIRLPYPDPSFGSLLVLAAGALFSAILATAMLIAPVIALFGRLVRYRVPSWVTLWLSAAVLLLICVAAALAGGLIVLRVRARLARRRRGPRFRRLDRLAPLDEAARRFPWRVVEHALRARGVRSAVVAAVLRRIGPGHLVALNSGCDWMRFSPMSSDIGFEPVLLGGDWDRQSSLICRNLQAQGLEIEFDASATAPPWYLRIIGRLSGLYRWTLVPLVVATCFAVAALTIGVGGLAARTIIASALALAWLVGLAVGMSFQRKWWAAPAALIYQEHRLWRRRPNVGLITPGDSSLIVDLDGRAYALEGGRLRVIGCPRWSVWFLLMAWISTARTPTREEAQAFAG